MDSVRFGRALGQGARSAAKAMIMAAEAAAAPAPRSQVPAATHATAKRSDAVTRAAMRAAEQTKVQVRATRAGLTRGGKRFGEAAWGPFVRLSGVLWLEMTGVFFGLFLLTALTSVWKLRGNLHDSGLNHTQHQRLLWSIAMAAVFGYFCISSFLRAARRQRQRG